ncbi:hypothetical protein QWZ08_09065 [Ferruginibacter paludis]|uniref:hypothetical protein n=1 Tax=Ferruginibacter paludis TaxID=1310417 RepID=UPI0025B54DBD|nr:hypothetical protein [Ferruginibacter paludis]MDN3655772.1 hypothetical protein [Ferruginibacter paludis]
MSGTNLTNVDANTTASVKAAASYLTTGDFYFNNNDFRPFLGAGAGLYQTAGAEVTQTTTDVTVASRTKFGGMVRGGFEYKHFRLGLEYNFIGKIIVPPTSGTSNDGYEIKNGTPVSKWDFASVVADCNQQSEKMNKEICMHVQVSFNCNDDDHLDNGIRLKAGK